MVQGFDVIQVDVAFLTYNPNRYVFDLKFFFFLILDSRERFNYESNKKKLMLEPCP